MDRMASIVMYKALPAVSSEYINIRLPGDHHLQTCNSLLITKMWTTTNETVDKYFLFYVLCAVPCEYIININYEVSSPRTSLLFHLNNDIGKQIME